MQTYTTRTGIALRLVGGHNFDIHSSIPRKRASKRAKATLAVPQLTEFQIKARAREILYAYKFPDGTNYKSLVDRSCELFDNPDSFTRSDERWFYDASRKIRLYLGIYLQVSDESQELDRSVYGALFDVKACLQSVPELKFASPFLMGLAL